MPKAVISSSLLILSLLVVCRGRADFKATKRATTKIYLQEFAEALGEYKKDCGNYPKNIESLAKNLESCKSFKESGYVPARYILKDPFGCHVEYKFGNPPTLKSLAKGCAEGGKGDEEDIYYQF